MKHLVIFLIVFVFFLPSIGWARPSLQEYQGAITSPRPNASLRGVVAINGTANHPDLWKYEVRVTAGLNPNVPDDQWLRLVVVENQPIFDGQLAAWDTTFSPDGAYTLRLRVVRRDGNWQDFDVYPVNIENNVPTPAPPTAIPPTAIPPTAIPPTAIPPTAVPPTAVPPTAIPPSPTQVIVPTSPPIPTNTPLPPPPTVTVPPTPTETLIPTVPVEETATPSESGTATPSESETGTPTANETTIANESETGTPTVSETETPNGSVTATPNETETVRPTATQTVTPAGSLTPLIRSTIAVPSIITITSTLTIENTPVITPEQNQATEPISVTETITATATLITIDNATLVPSDVQAAALSTATTTVSEDATATAIIVDQPIILVPTASGVAGGSETSEPVATRAVSNGLGLPLFSPNVGELASASSITGACFAGAAFTTSIFLLVGLLFLLKSLLRLFY